MDSIGRLKQLLENGVRVTEGQAPIEYGGGVGSRELLGIFPDGAKEYVKYSGRVENTHDKGDMYSRMIGLLKKEGVETEKLKIKSKINIDVHTLEMADGKIYHFFTPSRRYLGDKKT